VRVTVFGGAGAWPSAGQACSGYLVEHDGFRLLLDPGYAVTPLLDPGSIDGRPRTTYPEVVPAEDAPYLSSARQAGGGIEAERALTGAAALYAGPTSVARFGLMLEL
jgi:hypothetical protein